MAEGPEFRTTMDFAYGVARELAPGVVRLVANNPGPFTFKGTNTYLVGAATTSSLIDPGPEDAAHRDAILATIGRRRLAIFSSPTPTATTSTGCPRSSPQPAPGPPASAGARRSPASGAPAPRAASTSTRISCPTCGSANGDRLAGDGWAFTALHTPGHAPDHLSFELEGNGVLFSGDHVMGWNTSVIAPPEGSIADYMRSLELLGARRDRVYFPGHGGRVEEPQRLSRPSSCTGACASRRSSTASASGTNT